MPPRSCLPRRVTNRPKSHVILFAPLFRHVLCQQRPRISIPEVTETDELPWEQREGRQEKGIGCRKWRVLLWGEDRIETVYLDRPASHRRADPRRRVHEGGRRRMVQRCVSKVARRVWESGRRGRDGRRGQEPPDGTRFGVSDFAESRNRAEGEPLL